VLEKQLKNTLVLSLVVVVIIIIIIYNLFAVCVKM
jgi:hypothetical protein